MERPVWVFDTGDFLPAIPDTERSEYIIRAMQMVGYDAISVGDQEFLAGRDYFDYVFPTKQKLDSLYQEYLKKHQGYWIEFQFSGYGKFPEELKKSPSKIVFPRNIIYSDTNLCVFDFTFTRVFRSISGSQRAIILKGVIDPRAFLFFPEEHRQWFAVEPWEDYLENDLSARGLKVLLSHSGLMTDKEIAAEFPHIDIIIGGHSQHEMHEAVTVGETIIVQAGGSGRFVGRLDLKFTDNGDEVADYLYSLAPMTAEIPSDTAILAIIEEYEHAFFKDKKARPHITRYADSLDVLEPETCMECHQEQYDQWAGTDHANAFEIIEQRKKVYNPGCLSCHTTAYGHKDGFVTAESTPQWKNIGCSECHYMEGAHLTEPERRPVPVSEPVCIRCHTKRNSPDFDNEEYVRSVRH